MVHFKNMIIFTKLIIPIVLYFMQSDASEKFSSLGQMEDLIQDEKQLLSELKKYIEVESQRLNSLKRISQNFQPKLEYAKTNLESYLSHPVNQYAMIKRQVNGWSHVKNQVIEAIDTPKDFISLLNNKRPNFPNKTDTVGSAEAIIRLQGTYRLNTHLLASGYIKGSKSLQSLTAEDCYFIGRTAYLNGEYSNCDLWMREVLLRKESTYESFTLYEVLDHLAFCSARLGNVIYAYELTVRMMEINPTNERVINNYNYFQRLLGRNKKGDDGALDTNTYTQMDFFKTYESICRQPKSRRLPASIERKLKCYFWTNHGNPKLILQPLKMEELYHSPHIVRFYDFVNDKEMNDITKAAKPLLKRATVKNPYTGILETAKYRVSKSTWLEESISNSVVRVNQRISDATGLSMTSAEDLQIANYGVGGQYEPHWDFAREGDPGQFRSEVGNRIATLLIYMSDVPLGGYTVFLEPKVASIPIKGSAVFWYNLYPSGKGDLRTRHAACPVLNGIKWVSNKWIHERDQEFLHQCHLNENADNRIFRKTHKKHI